METQPQSYGTTSAVSRATRHRWTCPALTAARQAGTSWYPGRIEGWVDVGG